MASRDVSSESYAKCQEPGGVALGLAIDLGPATNAYTDNPSCPQGDTDRLAREMARAALADRLPGWDWSSSFTKFWSGFQRRTSSLGADFRGLGRGTAVGKGGALCQIFVLPVNVRAQAITRIEFQAAQGGRVGACYRTVVSKSPQGMEPYAFKNGGSCEIGWSGWQSGLVIDDKDGAVVAAVFKNWSQNLTRTGVLWVWY